MAASTRIKPPPINAIETRKIVSKSGTTGKKVTLLSNYFKLNSITDWCIYQYRVDIAPDESRIKVRKELLREHKASLGAYLFEGTMLFTSNRLMQPLELHSINKETKEAINIKIRSTGELGIGDYQYFHIFNIIMRKCLEHLKLQLVGRNYYDATNRVSISEYKLELWPGYITSIRQHEKNLLMCAELTFKVMRNENLYDLLKDIFMRNRNNYQTLFSQKVIGLTVITDYNNRTYKIDDIDYGKTPQNTFQLKDRSYISYADYYKQKYQIKIRDLKSPLLVSRSKPRDRRSGQDEFIYLIPELCRSTGITDEMRNDYRLMLALAEHTRVNPHTRMEKLMNFSRRMMSKSEIVQEFKEWNLNFDTNFVNVIGRELTQEKIYFDKKTIQPKNSDWSRDLQSNTPISVINLKDWIAIVPSHAISSAKIFIEEMIKQANQIKFVINRPRLIEIPNDRTDTYANAVSKLTDQANPQLIFCVVTNNQLQRYAAIKKKLCIDRPIPSQIILAKTLTQKTENRLKVIVTKVAIQMNCKIGGIPWTLEIGQLLPGLMVVGFDVCHNKVADGGAFGALVASLDQNFGRYFSAVSRHITGQELSNDISIFLTIAIEEFRRANNNKLPSRIIIYRDGVGEGQIPFVYDYEVNQIKKKLSIIYNGEDKFKLAFVIVTKGINTRFFLNGKNPAPGTVVDDIVTDPLKYDFFIVSQSVTQGTVSPTAYNVIEDNTGLSPDKMQILTYKFCHMYYNYSGTIRVPAPCFYAHKLAFFVSQALRQPAHQKLSKLLYFL